MVNFLCLNSRHIKATTHPTVNLFQGVLVWCHFIFPLNSPSFCLMLGSYFTISFCNLHLTSLSVHGWVGVDFSRKFFGGGCLSQNGTVKPSTTKQTVSYRKLVPAFSFTTHQGHHPSHSQSFSGSACVVSLHLSFEFTQLLFDAGFIFYHFLLQPSPHCFAQKDKHFWQLTCAISLSKMKLLP